MRNIIFENKAVKILCLVFIMSLVSCESEKVLEKPKSLINSALNKKNNKLRLKNFAKTITAKDLKKRLFIYGSYKFKSENKIGFGQKGNAHHLKEFYMSKIIKSPLSGQDYFQQIPLNFLRRGLWGSDRRKLFEDSENVVAFIKGAKKPDEVVIISAHLNRVSFINGMIFNRADDNGSATVAIMEIAEAFKEAVKAGKRPKRSVLFLHLSHVIDGLKGSEYYVKNPVFPLKNTVANLDIDKIGNVDSKHKSSPKYLYMSSLNKSLSSELYKISKKMGKKKFVSLDLDHQYDNNQNSRFYGRSYEHNFTDNNIPTAFYFGGLSGQDDYRAIDDTYKNINYKLLEKRTRLIFCTAWNIANRKSRVDNR